MRVSVTCLVVAVVTAEQDIISVPSCRNELVFSAATLCIVNNGAGCMNATGFS